MEETKKILIGLMLLVTLCGCSTIKNYFDPPPPLKEGEIPYVLAPGVYTDTEGKRHTVATNEPRWSVSEAMLYDAVSETESEDKLPWKRIGVFSGSGISALVLLGFAFKWFRKR